ASFFLGLGVFNKFDFVVFIASVGIAALCFYRRPLWAAFQACWSLTLILLLGFLFGAGPMILKIPRIFSYSASGQGATGRGELSEKLHTLFAMYDGSYFYRLMDLGGVFEKMYDRPAGVYSLLGFVLLIAALFLLTTFLTTRDKPQRRIAGFLLLGWVLSTI